MNIFFNASNLVITNENVSNFIFICYLILTIKDSRFLVAFFISELYGSIAIFDHLTQPAFYLGYSIIYCALYWCIIDRLKLKTILSVGFALTFYLWMSADAYFYGETETFTYNYYIYFEMVIHIYIISSLIRWQSLRKYLGASVDIVCRWSGINYNHSFICYNSFKATR